MTDRAANVILGVVLAVWALNVVAAITKFRGYEGSESLNGLVTVAIGAAFTYRAAKATDYDKRRRSRDERRDRRDDQDERDRDVKS